VLLLLLLLLLLLVVAIFFYYIIKLIEVKLTLEFLLFFKKLFCIVKKLIRLMLRAGPSMGNIYNLRGKQKKKSLDNTSNNKI